MPDAARGCHGGGLFQHDIEPVGGFGFNGGFCLGAWIEGGVDHVQKEDADEKDYRDSPVAVRVRVVVPAHWRDSEHQRDCGASAGGAGERRRYRLGRVRAGARSRVVRTKVDVDNLRQCQSLPPSSRKWKRLYRQRSAMERINSRVADEFMLHSHYLRGRKSMGLKITISMTVMLAVANFAIQCNKPEQVRLLVLSLAA